MTGKEHGSEMKSKIDIENDKVKKIINSAFKEFAKFGKEKASLNKILKASGISKGVFYHYFSDKEELFNFLVTYTAEISIQNLDEKIDWIDDDIIKRICEVTKLKLEIIMEHPYLIAFSEMFKHTVYESIDQDYLSDWRNKIYSHNIDLERLRNPSNAKEVINIARWTFKGLVVNMREQSGEHIDESVLSKLIEDCDHYYEVLASNFYK